MIHQVDVHDVMTMAVKHVLVRVRKAIATCHLRTILSSSFPGRMTILYYSVLWKVTGTYHLRTVLSYSFFPERTRMTILSCSVFHGERRRIPMFLPKMPCLGQKIVTWKEIVTDYVSRVILILMKHVHGDGVVTEMR